ncbi:MULTISPECIES: hypothetical protein [Pectobacterium]|uniref:hypothetical protein n=1 Tax=Pectobacterium TaxID=122277 RepID=UPI001CD357E3|nr:MULTISPECIES: hypothetical protein [Pectobacterium]UUE38726.1 hypothetical protein L0Y26_03185 [Pectobacterium aroidearum]UUE43104.1 hypothetical protein L0Y25_03180 [Pectobacterium aroidearum]UUE47324.1 hypothetical protein L0Y28_02970 [Pectobacterium aroidearum]UUE51524.1 hypothetical protein L0Y23_02975 [Pectobacterium aroidearum]UUE55745.1 hypothetical protein L0Y30_02975 [Pectobacterium aroidearum]
MALLSQCYLDSAVLVMAEIMYTSDGENENATDVYSKREVELHQQYTSRFVIYYSFFNYPDFICAFYWHSELFFKTE